MNDKHEEIDEANNNIFVKREKDEVKTSLIQTPVRNGGHLPLEEPVENENNSSDNDSCWKRIGRWMDKFKIKSGLAHIGLLMSLAAYTAAGGFVCTDFFF